MAKSPQPAPPDQGSTDKVPEIPVGDDLDAFFQANAEIDADNDAAEADAPEPTEPPDEPPAEPDSSDDDDTPPAAPAFDISQVPEAYREGFRAVMEGKPPAGYVPIQALDSERHAAKEARTHAERLSNAYENLMKLMPAQQAQQQAAPEPPKPETPPEPDYNENPADWLRWRNERLEERIEALSGRMPDPQAQQQQQQQYEAIQRLQSTIGSYEAEFEKANPDYGEALEHLRSMRRQELTLAGYDHAAVQQIIGQEELTSAARLLQQGRNPVEAAYEIAKLRGYKPDETGKLAAQQQSSDPPAKTPAEQGREKLATIAKGQQQAGSGGGGGAPGNTMPQTLEEVAEMWDRDPERASAAFAAMVGAGSKISFARDL